MRVMTHTLSVPFALSLLVSGCQFEGSARLVSYADASRPRQTYRSYLVDCDIEDELLRVQVEQVFASRLGAAGAHAYLASRVFPPVRQYSKEEFAATIARNRIEGILLVSATDSGVQQYSLPSTYVTRYAGGAWHTQQTGGGTYGVQWARGSIAVYDAASGQRAWLAKGSARGNGNAEVIRAVASQTIKHMMNDGLLPAMP